MLVSKNGLVQNVLDMRYSSMNNDTKTSFKMYAVIRLSVAATVAYIVIKAINLVLGVIV